MRAEEYRSNLDNIRRKEMPQCTKREEKIVYLENKRICDENIYRGEGEAYKLLYSLPAL